MIRIGIAGWDYPDWGGVVYPAGASRGFDKLLWVARFVDLVEINATFYRPADPRTAASWVRRTDRVPGFRFAAKAHRSWTHEAEPDLGAVVPPTLDGLAPLRDAGRLAALLVQFPQSFHRTEENLERLARLLDALAGWPVALEVRHVSWDDDLAAAWVCRHGVAWVVVDQPRVGAGTAPPRPRVTAPLAYLRLHGRNAESWFREGAGRDARYDWLYGPDEVRSLAETARTLSDSAAEVLVVQNNHFRGKAVVNALQMKYLLQGSAPPAPAPLVAAYPELAAFCASEPGRLF